MSLLSNKQKRKTQIRDRSLFIAVVGGGIEDFCCDNRALTWSPLKAYSVKFNATPPPPPSLLSQPPQKASVTICKQVISILILTSHEPWTTTLHIWSSDMNCIVCEGLLFSSKLLKKVIVALVLLTAEFFLIFFIPWFPVTFIFGTTRFVCVHRLEFMCR